MTVRECPIGLICEFFECDGYSHYCTQLARDWPLPYDDYFSFHPEWRKKEGFVVLLPSYWDYQSNDECHLYQVDQDNAWVRRVRDELWLGGWWESVELPYTGHPDGGLLVVKSFGLDDDATFACAWLFEDGYQRYPTWWESFEPAVPIDGYHRRFGKSPVSTDRYFVDLYDDPSTPDDERLLYHYHF